MVEGLYRKLAIVLQDEPVSVGALLKYRWTSTWWLAL